MSVETTCSVCGKEFTSPRESDDGLYYCSSECYYKQAEEGTIP